MRNLSHFLVMSDIFWEHSHRQRNLYMFEMPSSPRIFLFSKRQESLSDHRQFKSGKKRNYVGIIYKWWEILVQKTFKIRYSQINCFLGGTSISPPISPKIHCLPAPTHMPVSVSLLASISLWARALPKISGKVWGKIGTYHFLVSFLIIPSPQVCTYVDSTVRCPFTKFVSIIRSG